VILLYWREDKNALFEMLKKAVFNKPFNLPLFLDGMSPLDVV
jgi:hypothetical protein